MTAEGDVSGLIFRGEWKKRVVVPRALVDDHKTFGVWREGDVLRIRVANGQAAYRIMEEDDSEDAFMCELAYSELNP